MNISKEARTTREDSVGWVMQRLAKRLNDEMDKQLATLDLTVAQFAVMMTVLESGGMTQTEIGRRFGWPAYSITRVLNALEERGLLERRADPSSRRAFNIYASAEGKKLGPELFAIVQAVNSEFMGRLPQEDRAEFRRMITLLMTG